MSVEYLSSHEVGMEVSHQDVLDGSVAGLDKRKLL